MFRFLFWRLVQSLVVLWVVYTVTFFLLMAAPGDPFIGDKKPPESVIKGLAEKYGLEYLTKSPQERAGMSAATRARYLGTAYVHYMGNLLRGDFGPSIQYENWTVSEIIAASLPVSAALGAAALLLALIGGYIAGTIGAVYKSRWPDNLLTLLTLLGISLPTFVVGALLLMLFASELTILPTGGWGSLSQIVLPALTLALFFLAYIARLTRSSTLDVFSADYVRTARAKGLSNYTVISKHVGANAALDILSYLGPAAAYILTGSFVVEKIFNVPGLGTHFVNGCLNFDIPLVLGAVIVYTAIVVFFNLLVDVAYVFVDPRIAIR